MNLVLMWFAAFGIWPFARPPHDFSTLGSVADLLIHWVAMTALLVGLLARYREARGR